MNEGLKKLNFKKLTFLKSKFPGLSIQLTGHIGNIKKKSLFQNVSF